MIKKNNNYYCLTGVLLSLVLALSGTGTDSSCVDAIILISFYNIFSSIVNLSLLWGYREYYWGYREYYCFGLWNTCPLLSF